MNYILHCISGEPSRSSTADIIVTVMDVNDLSPVFAESQYNGSIQEGLGPGEAIIQVCMYMQYYFNQYIECGL